MVFDKIGEWSKRNDELVRVRDVDVGLFTFGLVCGSKIKIEIEIVRSFTVDLFPWTLY